MRVALTGSTSPLGARVAAALLDASRSAVDVRPLRNRTELGELEGCDALVHLGRTVEPGEREAPDGAAEVDGAGTVPDPAATRRLLADAAEAGIDQVVVVSSAMVYGAWPTNPVPLTEEALLKPNPSLRFAVERAEEERLVALWRAEHPGARVAVLRPTVQVAEDRSSWLSRSLWSGPGVQPGEAEPPVQFVHLDDVASAVALAVRDGLDGAFNVAPDGWLAASQLRALSGTPRLHLPHGLVTRLVALRWRLGLVASPPGVVAYLAEPWVVANDKLRDAGWTPRSSNEEAFVAADRPGPLATLSPKRRQELALGVAGVALAGLGVGLGLAVRRALRGRRSRGGRRGRRNR